MWMEKTSILTTTKYAYGLLEGYIKQLYAHTKRVFHNATVTFVLPFSGMTGVSDLYIRELKEAINYACPEMIVVFPPYVKSMISRGGIHLNRAGKDVFLRFLHSQLVTPKQRIFASDSGRRGQQPVTGVQAQSEQQSPVSSDRNAEHPGEVHGGEVRRDQSDGPRPPDSVADQGESTTAQSYASYVRQPPYGPPQPGFPPGFPPGLPPGFPPGCPPLLPVHNLRPRVPQVPPDLHTYFCRTAAGVVEQLYRNIYY